MFPKYCRNVRKKSAIRAKLDHIIEGTRSESNEPVVRAAGVFTLVGVQRKPHNSVPRRLGPAPKIRNFRSRTCCSTTIILPFWRTTAPCTVGWSSLSHRTRSFPSLFPSPPLPGSCPAENSREENTRLRRAAFPETMSHSGLTTMNCKLQSQLCCHSVQLVE